MIGETMTVTKWYGTQMKVDINGARDSSLPKIGAAGVQIMRSKAPFVTGETQASIMWRTHDKQSAIGYPADPSEVIAKPRSRRAVTIGSAMGAGRYTQKGERISVITSIEYGHKTSGGFVAPHPFIRPSFSSISRLGKQIFAEDIRPVINKGGA